MNLEKDPDPNTTPAVLDTAWRHGWNEAPTGYNSILCREVLISLRIQHAFPCFTRTAHPEGRSRTSHTSTRSAQPYNARHPWRSIGVCRTLLHADMEEYSPDVRRGGETICRALSSRKMFTQDDARRLPKEKHVIGKLRPTPHRWREPAGARPLPAREIKTPLRACFKIPNTVSDRRALLLRLPPCVVDLVLWDNQSTLPRPVGVNAKARERRDDKAGMKGWNVR